MLPTALEEKTLEISSTTQPTTTTTQAIPLTTVPIITTTFVPMDMNATQRIPIEGGMANVMISSGWYR